MGQSPNRYLNEPRLYELSTQVAAFEALQFGGWAIAGTETIFRPEGGGQPQDHGSVEVCGIRHKVAGLHKAGGRVFVHLPGLMEQPLKGIPIEMAIDSNRRDRLSKSHTLQHMFSAVTHRVMPGVEVVETGVFEDASGAWISLKHDDVALEPLYQIDRQVRSIVLRGTPVWVQKLKSVEHCEWEFGSLLRSDSKASLSGKVRVVVIEDFDANCCSGTHWHSSNVGPYEMKAVPVDETDNLMRLEFRLRDAWMYWYPDAGPMKKLDRPEAIDLSAT